MTMLGELALKRGRLHEASECLARAVENFDGAHAAHAGLAEIDRRRGDLATARDRLRRLVDRHPRPVYWIALGEVCAALDDPNRARSWFDRAEEVMLGEVRRGDLGHARALVELWLEHDGDVEQAVVLALEDLKEVRRDAGAFATAARALHAAGRTEEAVEHMAEALKRTTADPSILLHAAKIYGDAGRVAASRQLQQQARK